VVGKSYTIGFFFSPASTVFPRKDSPNSPYTTGNITVTGCRATTDGTSDVYPGSINYWAPFMRVVEN
jgi:hypothetical protein